MKRVLILAITGIFLTGVITGCGSKADDELPPAKSSGLAGTTGGDASTPGGIAGGGPSEALKAPVPGGKSGGGGR